jgi:CRP/FNR family transcriptional regulator
LFSEGAFSPVSAIVLEEANVCSIDIKSFERIIVENPEIALQIIKNLNARLYDTWEKITELNTQTIQEKVISFFIQLAQEQGEPYAEGTLIKIPLTQQEIASAVGASRVMVSQALQELIKSNYICRKKKHYIVKRKCIY